MKIEQSFSNFDETEVYTVVHETSFVVPILDGDGGPSGPADWDTLLNKPSTFPPSAHTHALSSLSDVAVIDLEDSHVLLWDSGEQSWFNSDILVGLSSTLAGMSAGIASRQLSSEKDQPSGYAGLNGSSKIALSQIPDITYNMISDISSFTALIQSAWQADIVSGLTAKQDTVLKNQANGYAGLDGSGKINPSQLPALAITETFVVNSQSAMLALTAETGDVAIRTDVNKSFVLSGTASTLADWKELLAPLAAVSSVFGRTGAITAQSGDYTTDQITEGTAKFFTSVRVMASVISGYVIGARTALANTDTVEGAFNKIGKWLADLSNIAFSGSASDLTGTKTSSFISDFGTAVAALITGKQDTLVSGTNIKSVNGNSLLGSGNLVVSGAPAGSADDIQINTAGAFAGATDFKHETGQLRLNEIATPAAPASGGLKLYSRALAGVMSMLAMLRPNGLEMPLQPSLVFGTQCVFVPVSSTTINMSLGWTMQNSGTISTPNISPGSLRGRMHKTECNATSGAAAHANIRSALGLFTVGGGNAWEGGFYCDLQGGPTGGPASNSTHRYFLGLASNVVGSSDVNPSTLTRIVGIGYDDTDTQVQFMYNDASGVATKVALGASFPKPNVDRAFTYRLEMFSPKGPTQSVSYRVTYLETGAVATGTINTNLPGTSDLLQLYSYTGTGGTGNAGLALMRSWCGCDW